MPTYVDVKSRSFKNRKHISDDTPCVCYYCESRLKGKEIVEWLDGNQTPVCPHCGIDAVSYEHVEGEFSDELIHETYIQQFETGRVLKKDGTLSEPFRLDLDNATKVAVEVNSSENADI